MKCFELLGKLKHFVAERKGFEPSIRFWRIHTFQACAFDHSATSLYFFVQKEHSAKWAAK